GQRPVANTMSAKPAAPAAVTAQARPAAAPTTAKSAPQSPTRVAQQPAKKAIFANSNVKEVMAALDSHGDPMGETRLMPAPLGRGDTADDSSLTDTQVLRFLEARREEGDAAQA